MTILTIKITTLYAACSPELGLVSYGHCQEEAINNLTDQLRQLHSTSAAEQTAGYERKQAHGSAIDHEKA